MVRTQIQLTEEQARKLKEMAAEKRISVAALIRRAVDRLFQDEVQRSRQERWQRSLTVLGKYSSNYADVSTNHDAHLAEIYGEW